MPPVTRADFDRGRTELTHGQAVVNYLQEHPDQAYTARELAVIVNPPKGAPPVKGTGHRAKFESAMHTAGERISSQGFKMSLDLMVVEKKLQSKRVKSNGKTRTYYTLPRVKKAKA